MITAWVSKALNKFQTFEGIQCFYLDLKKNVKKKSTCL